MTTLAKEFRPEVAEIKRQISKSLRFRLKQRGVTGGFPRPGHGDEPHRPPSGARRAQYGNHFAHPRSDGQRTRLPTPPFDGTGHRANRTHADAE